jgi:creatinine amidohydrolase
MVRLAHRTTTTVAEALADVEVALLPTGSIEQHGPALPLGTDFMTARAFARSFDDSEDVLVLPPVPVGVSEHHRQFHGTLWVSPDTFEWYVRETLAGLSTHGVERAVVVNGHGGNDDAVDRAARRLRTDRVCFAPGWNWWESVTELADDLFDGEGGHAGARETSLVLHVERELVREDALEPAETGASDGWGQSVHGAGVGFDTLDFSESGAVGRPTDASAEAGARLFEAAREELAALVDWLAERPAEDLWPREHVSATHE